MSTTDGELSREHFAKLASPIKHYLTDSIGMDELNAGLLAANIVQAQTTIILSIIKQEKLEARIEVEEWHLDRLIGLGHGHDTLEEVKSKTYKRLTDIEFNI
jgi:hypothetical protein